MKSKISVLMSIYEKETPCFFRTALDSVFNQTLPPDEVILVEDGKLTSELEKTVIEYEKKYPVLKVIRNKENRGLGYALNDGLKSCTYEYVFRMDTDDICRKDRFEIQMNYLHEHPDIDVLGSNIYEFKDNLNEKMRIKKMPHGIEICSYILKRNPINHMTVCFKKSAVEECGSYKPMRMLEDYYLWLRMFKKQKKIDNIDDELVYARIGNGFEKRRGNKSQLSGWKELQKYMLDNDLISYPRYIKNKLNMYGIVYCPTFIRKIIYKAILRKD